MARGTLKKIQVISPQLTVTAATPTQVSSAELLVYSAVIFSHRDNVGAVYISPTAAACTADESITILPGDRYEVVFDHNRGVAWEFNMQELYFDGVNTGDKLIVHYTQ